MADRKKVIKNILIALIAACILTLAFFAGYYTRYFSRSEDEKLMEWALGLIGDNYMVYDEETGELKEYTADDYLKAIAGSLLDPYSVYYTKEEYTDLIATSQGNQYGVGVTFLYTEERALIFSVVGNSPAERAGIEAGGLITAAEYAGEKKVVSSYQDFADALLNIPANTEFVLYIDYGEGERAFTVQKESFKESYVFYADSETGYMFLSEDGSAPVGTPRVDKRIDYLPDDTAYIRYDSFMYTSAEQFGEAYAYMFSRGRSNLILDLRNNGGGYLDVMAEIGSYFLGDNQLLAVAHSRHGEQRFYGGKSRKNANLKTVVVLGNENTASASEALTGALIYYGVTDYDHIVVTKNAQTGKAATYGKGIMQTTYPGGNGSALTLTTAYIYWPDNETCIHEKGIVAKEENGILAEAGADKELERAVEILGA